MAQSSQQLFFQIMLIGDSGVGKTCLLHRFVGEIFPHKYAATIGVDFKHFETSIEDEKVKVQLWDTAGQERFRTVTSSYYRKADGIIVVYDIRSEETFEHCRNVWLKEIDYYANDNVTILLLGNCCEDSEKRQVSTDTAQDLAASLGIKFQEVSAKDSTNVENALLSLISDIKDRVRGKSTAVTEINKTRKRILYLNEMLTAHEIQLEVLEQEKKVKGKKDPSQQEIDHLEELKRQVEFTGKGDTVLDKGSDDLKRDIKKIQKDIQQLEKKLAQTIHTPRKRDSIILEAPPPSQPLANCCS